MRLTGSRMSGAGSMRDVILHAVTLCAVTLCAVTPLTLAAQELRGTVVQSDGVSPASGAIVVLLRAASDSVIARAVTGSRGFYALRAPAAGEFRVQVLRVGHRPMAVGRYALGASDVQLVDIALADAPVMLAAFDVREAARCDVRPDSARLVAQLYEEARKALIVSSTQATGVRSTAEYDMFTRIENLRGRAVAPTQRSRVSGPSNRPFQSISVDSLMRVGYVVEESDGTVYRAPDADVLLSDAFAASHCMFVADGGKERPSSIGIGFRPVATRRGFIDIRGTLWLDRASSELQDIEYTFDGIPREHQRGGVGGRVEFARTSDGGWLVNRWAIRMPRITTRELPGRESVGARGSLFRPTEQVVDTIVVTGGEVRRVMVDGELQYASAATISGDELPQSIPVAPGGGAAALAAAQASLANGAASGASSAAPMRADTISVVSTCEGPQDQQYRGVVQGRVLGDSRSGVPGVAVAAEWKQDFRHIGGNEWRWEYRRVSTTSTAGGGFVLCGAPVDRPVTVLTGAQTAAGARRTGMVLRLSSRDPRATVDLVDAASVVAGGRSSLLRVVDPRGQPVPHAVVRVGDALSRVADGEGRVVLPVITRDSAKVLVRRIGYTPFDGWVTRPPVGQLFQVTIAPAGQQLATVDVRASTLKSPLELSGFYDRMVRVQRGAMVGDFITPEDLEVRGNARISQLLAGNRYAKIVYLSMTQGGKTQPVLVGRNNCPMTVVIDGQRSTGVFDGSRGSGEGMPSVDDLVTPGSTVAIEIYPTVSGAPVEFIPATGETFCGIAVIWTGAR